MSNEQETYTYFAYLDVLGYKNYLQNDINNSEMIFKAHFPQVNPKSESF